MRGQDYIQKKMTRASIAKVLLGSLSAYGFQEGSRLSLTAEECRNLKGMVERLRRLFNEMGEKGGYVLVKNRRSDVAITTYRMSASPRKHLKAKGDEGQGNLQYAEPNAGFSPSVMLH